MNLRRIFIKNDKAVSPVIGVTLTAVITIILTTVIASSIIGFGVTNKGPMMKFTVTDHADDLNITNIGDNNLVLFHHGSGDSLDLSEISIQIKGPGDSSFIKCITNKTAPNAVYYADLSGPMSVGETRIITTDTKNSSNTGTYNIRIIHVTTRTILLDTKIAVV